MSAGRAAPQMGVTAQKPAIVNSSSIISSIASIAARPGVVSHLLRKGTTVGTPIRCASRSRSWVAAVNPVCASKTRIAPDKRARSVRSQWTFASLVVGRSWSKHVERLVSHLTTAPTEWRQKAVYEGAGIGRWMPSVSNRQPLSRCASMRRSARRAIAAIKVLLPTPASPRMPMCRGNFSRAATVSNRQTRLTKTGITTFPCSCGYGQWVIVV